jgi:hypothetical protein
MTSKIKIEEPFLGVVEVEDALRVHEQKRCTRELTLEKGCTRYTTWKKKVMTCAFLSLAPSQ